MIHGVLLVDKPTGMTSHDVVYKVRRQVRQKSVGHAGTLDPLASGLLVVLLGEATKISDYLLNEDKGYQVEAQFGVHTDTWDITGEVQEQKEVLVSSEAAMNAAMELQGPRLFEVPMYSAIKVNGKKLYEYARNDEKIDVPPREMSFYNIKNLKAEQNTLSCSLKCLKGGYIRSWVVELGRQLGVPSTMKSLRRTISSPYDVSQAVKLEDLIEMEWSDTAEFKQKLGSAFIPLAETLTHCKALTVSGRDKKLLLNGQVPVDLDRRLLSEQKRALKEQKSLGVRIFSGETGDMISILEARPNKGLRVKRVFQLNR